MPESIFQTTIANLLAPILASDQAAARDAIAAYDPKTPDDVLIVAQIIAFGLCGLDSLRLSMREDVPPAIKLKLRGSANAMTRSARQAALILDNRRRDTAWTTPEAPISEVPISEVPILTAPVPAAVREPNADTPRDRAIDQGWADAMTDVAAEFTAELANLSPAQRSLQLRKIAALNAAASSLERGEVPLKSRLFGTRH